MFNISFYQTPFFSLDILLKSDQILCYTTLVIGLCALPGLMLEQGLLKIIWGSVFIAPVGGSNPEGPYPNPFPKPAGQK